MKTALITGAKRGLGAETARQLTARGWRVIRTGRGGGAGLLDLDVTDPVSVARVAAQVPELDVLINNAAIITDRDQNILTLALTELEKTFATNVLGVLRVAQAFVPHLSRSAAGRIVNVSSGGGQLSETSTFAPAYCISKTALNGVTCQLAAALKEKNIAVNSVCPGWCRTEMGGDAAPRSAEKGAAGIVWLATDAPQEKTGLFWRDQQMIPW